MLNERHTVKAGVLFLALLAAAGVIAAPDARDIDLGTMEFNVVSLEERDQLRDVQGKLVAPKDGFRLVVATLEGVAPRDGRLIVNPDGFRFIVDPDANENLGPVALQSAAVGFGDGENLWFAAGNDVVTVTVDVKKGPFKIRVAAIVRRGGQLRVQAPVGIHTIAGPTSPLPSTSGRPTAARSPSI
jgi:hypothetical protein